MEGYLAHKWGVANNLPSSHTYKAAAPETSVWSAVKSFTTPTNTTAPTLGTQSTANVAATTADLEVVLLIMVMLPPHLNFTGEIMTGAQR